MERDGVVEGKLRSAPENLWYIVLSEIPREGVRNICEYEGYVLGQRFGEDCGQSGEGIVRTNGDAGNSAIDEDENSSDGVDLLLNLNSNILLVDLVLLKTASVGQSRCIEDTNLCERLCPLLSALNNAGSYQYVAVAHQFINAGRVGLAMLHRTTLFIVVVEDVEVIVISTVTKKDVGDEFHE